MIHVVWANRPTELSVTLSIAASVIHCVSKHVQYIIGIAIITIIIIELMLSGRVPSAGVRLRFRADGLPTFQDVTCPSPEDKWKTRTLPVKIF